MARTPSILTLMPTLDAMPTADELDSRIDAIMALPTATPSLIEDGWRWYIEHAPHAILDIAIHYDADIRTVAGMLAAMSAGYSWPMSLEHIGTLFEGSRDGIAAPYGWRAIEQAEAIRDGADPDVILRNTKGATDTVKRWNFFHNLLGETEPITVDVHMARGLTGGFIAATPATPSRYRHLADAIRRAAIRFGYTPAAMQAILWSIIRGEAH